MTEIQTMRAIGFLRDSLAAVAATAAIPTQTIQFPIIHTKKDAAKTPAKKLPDTK